MEFIIYLQKYSCITWFFGIEYSPQGIFNKIREKSATHNIFRIQSDDSIMCGFYCITFIEYITARKTLLDYTNLLLPNDYQKKDKLMYKYFKEKCGRRKHKPRL